MAWVHAYGPSWVHETPYLPEGWEETSKTGAPTLKHAAMKQTLSNQRNLTPGLFADVPWPIASYLWDCLGRSRNRTLYMWKLFATAYPDAFARVAQYRLMKIGSLKLSLRDYLGMVRSDSLNWRVVLTLATSFAKVPELVEISRVRNLVALEISTPREVQSVVDGDSGDLEMSVTALSDRIFRTWSELAQGAGAFAHLRVLKLYYQEDLSKGVLQYLMEFPSLRFLIVYECPGLSSIGMDEDLDGWEVTAEPVVSKEWPVMSLYSSYQASLVADIDGEPSTINLICPILDFQIGPRTGPLPSREHDRAKTLCLRRRTEPRPASKKLKTIQKPSGPRKRMMKDRRGKDIGESLREFL